MHTTLLPLLLHASTVDIKRQKWNALNTTNGAWLSDLNDGIKYMLGIGFLPTGWEYGTQHEQLSPDDAVLTVPYHALV